MSNVLVIDSEGPQVDIALLSDKRLVELHKEGAGGNKFCVGDMYLGRVKKLAPGLNAAFVDIGSAKDAFLHYLDLGPQVRSLNKYLKGAISGNSKGAWLETFQLEPDIDKRGNISDVLSPNQNLLVQITKEPISTKGPRISSEVTVAGRYIVLVPFSNRVSVSQRIKSRDERERLRRLMDSIRPPNFGVIIRTNAENVKVAELDADLSSLTQKWEKSFNNLKEAQPRKRVLSELSRANTMMRDMLNESFVNIHINDYKFLDEVKNYLKTIAPEKENIAKLYRGKQPIFDYYGIEKQIKSLFGKHVTMPSGAYLVIEHTEALHVVDVNSGNTSKKGGDQEANALEVNIESAMEIARQLRLRDMGGIVVVDFIDLRKAEHKRKLHDVMRNEMKADKAKHNILPLSKFGLMQITRQRVRPQMTINTSEVCPSCNGSGEIQASILLIDEIETNLHKIIDAHKGIAITLNVHPFVAAYLKKGVPSMQNKWFMNFKRRVRIQSMTSYSILEYKFVSGQDEELTV